MQKTVLTTIIVIIFILLALCALVMLKELFLGNRRQLNTYTRKLVNNFKSLNKEQKKEVEELIAKHIQYNKANKKPFFGRKKNPTKEPTINNQSTKDENISGVDIDFLTK